MSIIPWYNRLISLSRYTYRMIHQEEQTKVGEIRRVFIVDDDESIGRALTFLLKTYGYEVKAFLSGKEFLLSVPESEQGCLILDVHMPEMDGWEVLRRITSRGSKRCVIVVTANKDGDHHEKALQAGAIGFLLKPLNTDALIELIDQSFK